MVKVGMIGTLFTFSNVPLSCGDCVGLAKWLACPLLTCTVGRGFVSRPGHNKDHHKIVQTASLPCTHALRYEFDSAPRLSERPGSVWNCLRGHALKRSPNDQSQEKGIVSRSRISV